MSLLALVLLVIVGAALVVPILYAITFTISIAYHTAKQRVWFGLIDKFHHGGTDEGSR